jgi:phage anti-repressor protein
MSEETLKMLKEERKKELLSHLDIHDKLDVRDPQSSAEYAPMITSYMFEIQDQFISIKDYTLEADDVEGGGITP